MSEPNQSLTSPDIESNRHKKDYQPVLSVYCSTCKKDQHGPIMSHKTGTGTYLCCLIWCCVAVIPGLIPFCCDRCKDKVYTCPECKLVVRKDPYEPCNCD